MVIVNKRMNAINKALANAKWLYDTKNEFTPSQIMDNYERLIKLSEYEICGNISLKYRIEYHESIFKPYYDGLVTKDELLLALEGAKFNGSVN